MCVFGIRFRVTGYRCGNSIAGDSVHWELIECVRHNICIRRSHFIPLFFLLRVVLVYEMLVYEMFCNFIILLSFFYFFAFISLLYFGRFVRLISVF